MKLLLLRMETEPHFVDFVVVVLWLCCSSPASPKMGLLFVILSVIFMKEGVVKESERGLFELHTTHHFVYSPF